MPETPDAILRALADPERLAIAGHLARTSATAATLAEAVALRLPRVRKHLSRLTAAGVIRLLDRRTYRLDAETLRWAAEQVGPPREVGLVLAAANEDEEAVLRAICVAVVESDLDPRATSAGVTTSACTSTAPTSGRTATTPGSVLRGGWTRAHSPDAPTRS
ncbi:MAG: helix-turn-helix domain-containing protein [Actinomycetota bacterium]